MADIMTPEQRHRCMAAVKGKDTKPEMIVRRYLHSLGYRYGLHNKKLPGSPDLVIRKYKTVIFIHGCFWHGHEGCKYSRLPKTNESFWKEKISVNRKRDEQSKEQLEKSGWTVLTVWECDLKNRELREKTLENLREKLNHIMSPLLDYNIEPELSIAAEDEMNY